MAQGTTPETEKNNGRYPTMSEIAKRCGVSQSTVSRALHNVKGRQREDTRDRIVAVAREMGYDPMQFQAARRLAEIRHGSQSLNYIIGFFFYHTGFGESNYLSRIQQGVLSGISRTDFEMLTSDFTPKVEGGEVVISPPYRRGEVDGALIVEQDPAWRLSYNALREHPNFGSRPMVGLVSHLEGCSGVYADNFSAGYQVLSHLLAIGHRHVVCQQELIDSGRSVQAQRVSGYRQACDEAGLAYEAVVSQLLWANHQTEIHEAQLINYLRQRPEVTAVICANDQTSVDVHRTLVGAGYRVPEDVSIASYDDTDTVTDGRGNNMLTTTRLPLNEVGKQGAELLIRRILGKEMEDRDIVLPVQLVVRASTAPPARR